MKTEKFSEFIKVMKEVASKEMKKELEEIVQAASIKVAADIMHKLGSLIEVHISERSPNLELKVTYVWKDV